MSAGNYEYCPGCENKALYVGEEEVPGNLEVWHSACVVSATIAAANAETDRIRQMALKEANADRPAEWRAAMADFAGRVGEFAPVSQS